MSGYVAVVGENVADVIVQPADPQQGAMSWCVFPGGGPANTAVALGRLGAPTRFVSRLPHGVFGCLFTQRLTASEVDLSLCIHADEPATLAITSIDQGTAHYEFYAVNTADWQWRPTELDPRKMSEAACVHAGSLGLVMEPGGRVVEELLESVRGHATISIDPNVRTTLVGIERYRERLKEWCRLADVFRTSEDDLDQLAPNVSAEQFAAELHEDGVQLAIVTRGEHGVFASLRGDVVEVPAAPTRVVDTIGAGDAFSAGLLHWLYQTGQLGGRLDQLDDGGLRRALTFAIQVAALTCAVPGADPPWNGELTPAVRKLLR